MSCTFIHIFVSYSIKRSNCAYNIHMYDINDIYSQL